MVSDTVSALDTAKSEAKALLAKRDELEQEMEAASSQLRATGAGEHGSLVDKEGFPRADAFEVRELRQRLDRLKNDLGRVNTDMEAALHRAHAAARGC
mmetsp:Transcript_1849/g.5418  ORF Transcript_1849/g.5418 Transcript_1849/m.5418 type:complete len:98 (-) Transcript_1849:394-687(-)